jgi:hypothetical protein
MQEDERAVVRVELKAGDQRDGTERGREGERQTQREADTETERIG